jgi:hypothetical protein
MDEPRLAPRTCAAWALLAALCAACGDPYVHFDDVPTEETPVPTAGAGGSVEPPMTTPKPMQLAGSGGTSGGGVSSGGSSMGGDAGQAGEAGAGPLPAPIVDVIDDVEGQFPQLPERAGRNGGWYVVHDETGGAASQASAVQLDPPRGESERAAGFTGYGFTAWGAQLGVALRSPATGYDASDYCGLRFVAKGSGSGFRLIISDRFSDPAGGLCDTGDPSLICYDSPTTAFQPTAEWQTFEIPFEELTVSTQARKLDASLIFDIVFNVGDQTGAAFELLVDDLAFVPCE